MKKTLMITAAMIALASCSTSHPGGMPAPQLTFANFTPQRLNVQSATVSEAYEITNDPQDVSGQFVISPADAIKRYAAQRYQASGAGGGQFTILIEDARVHMREDKEKSKVLAWADAGTEDIYELFLRLRVTPEPDGFNGRQSTIIKMERTLVMPSSVALAEREMRQTRFLETLVTDVDKKIQDLLDATPAIRQ